MSRKKVKAQQRVFKELEKQLLTQAERIGIKDRYSPLRLKEIEYDALRNHILSFYAERANLEYEMQMLGTDKREVLIKLERLGVYIKRAERMQTQYEKKIKKMLEILTPDKKAVNKLMSKKGVSVMVGGNN